MAKKKKLPPKRFCNSCQRRTIFNRTREDKLICSVCGMVFDSKEILPEVMKIQDPKSIETFK